MGKTKGRSRHSHDQEPTERMSVQNLKSIIRKLKKENESLRRELRKRGSVQEEYTQLLQEVEDVEVSKPRANSCPFCLKGTLTDVDLGPRRFAKCSSCSYKKVTKVKN